MKQATMKNLNEHIRSKYGEGLEFVKGRGYFYFCTDERQGWMEISSIYIYALKQADYDFWIRDIDIEIEKAIELRDGWGSSTPLLEQGSIVKVSGKVYELTEFVEEARIELTDAARRSTYVAKQFEASLASREEAATFLRIRTLLK